MTVRLNESKLPQNASCLIQHALAFMLLSVLSIVPAWSATYYVATDGNDSSSGSSVTSPFRTVTKAMNTAVGGDTVLLRGGNYREQVDVTVGGGSAGNYVTVAAYNGEIPVIKGSDVVTGWVQHSGNIWKKTGWTVNSQQVFVDFDAKPGKPLQQIGMPSSYFTTFEYNAQVGTGLSSMTAGTFYYDASSTTMYVWLADSSDPNNHVMEVSTRMRLFYMAKPYIYMKGLYFRHSNVTASAQQGVAVELSSNSIIEASDIQWTDFGGLSMGYLQNNTQAINNNISNNGDTGINAPGTSNFKVSQNRLNSNNYRNFNALWHAGGFKAASKAYGVVEANEAANNNGSGIWFDYCNGGGQIVIRNNYIHDNGPKDSAIYFEVSINGLIYNNVLVNNKRRGIYLSGASGTQVLNNTIIGTGDYAAIELGGMPREGATLVNNTIFNNVISGTTAIYDLLIAPENGTDIVNNRSNYNNIYRQGQPLKLATSSLVSSLGAWRSLSGLDMNSLSVDPGFTSSGAAAAYTLADGSPMIDAGTNVGGVVIADYSAAARPQGAGYDIGAFEKSAASAPVTPVASTPTPAPAPVTGKDVIAPVVSLSGLAPSTTVSGSIKIAATATDNVGVTEMSLYIDGDKKAGSTAGQIGFIWDLTGVRAGTHEVRISASDAAQNTGKVVTTLIVQPNAGTTAPTTPVLAPTPAPVPAVDTGAADRTPPVVTISGPGTGSSVTGTVTISASATDNRSVTEMTIMVDGVVKATSSSGSISYGWNTAGLRAGTHSIRVSAGDAAQNTGSGNISVVVQ